MLDIRLIRERTEEVKARLGARGLNIDWDLLLKLDQERRDLLNAVEELRAQRRTASDQIAKLKRDKKPAEPLVEEMKSVGDRIAALEDELRSCEADLNNIALSIPNLPHESVPIGVDASANVDGLGYLRRERRGVGLRGAAQRGRADDRRRRVVRDAALPGASDAQALDDVDDRHLHQHRDREQPPARPIPR